jgi:hypothetical protein
VFDRWLLLFYLENDVLLSFLIPLFCIDEM